MSPHEPIAFELRPLSEADAPRLFAMIEASRTHLEPWLMEVRDLRSVDATRGWIRQREAARRAGSSQYWLAWSVVGEPLGVVGYHLLDRDERHACVGCWIAAAHAGTGLMRRIVQRCIDELVPRKLVDTLRWNCDAANAASRRLAERLGFGLERVEERIGPRLADHRSDHVTWYRLDLRDGADAQGSRRTPAG